MFSYQFDWSGVTSNIPEIAHGLLVTVEITAIVSVLSMILAVPVGFARMSQIEVVRWATQGYIEAFRCTPMLVQLFWIYYALPALFGITLPGFTSAIIALTANMTAFTAEALRSGFQAVPVEQIEAAKMLRLNSFQRTMHIILPQATRQQLPVLLSLNISLFKDTALVSTIAVSDLFFVSSTVATQTYRSFEPLTVAALLYFAIAFPASLITSRIERNMLMSGQMTQPRRRGLRRIAPNVPVRTA
jgi:polar amino acid transport system permease protein